MSTILNYGSTGSPKDAVMEQIKQEAAIDQARKLIDKMNELCFEKCIPSPGTSLSRKEEGCISMCMEKYIDTRNVVSRAWNQGVQRIQREHPTRAGALGKF
ncbi:protein translocase subunit [Xylographa bjoerkii]|nr:protein translocase subunit [Xylographa bjoerkii]